MFCFTPLSPSSAISLFYLTSSLPPLPRVGRAEEHLPRQPQIIYDLLVPMSGNSSSFRSQTQLGLQSVIAAGPSRCSKIQLSSIFFLSSSVMLINVKLGNVLCSFVKESRIPNIAYDIENVNSLSPYAVLTLKSKNTR